jgi:hypothetical protein
MNELSLLDQIIEDFTMSLSKDPSFGQEISQSLKELINKGAYKDKDVIIKLLKKRTENENSQS